MRFEGVLTAWDPGAGYGAIQPAGGGEKVVVGLAAFPTDGEGPRPDEWLSFEIVTGRDGRKHAVNLKRVVRNRPTAALREAVGAGSAHVRARKAQRRRRSMLLAGGVVATLMLVSWGALRWQSHHPSTEVATMAHR
ncbi:cold-shock protein [Roseateles sp. BYS87W]|uniref:Cold-shock protein n=1 Tax=Pelomonas baiyunensis TaxID=3299026 RepID=A0ABW7H3T1_9BURK